MESQRARCTRNTLMIPHGQIAARADSSADTTGGRYPSGVDFANVDV